MVFWLPLSCLPLPLPEEGIRAHVGCIASLVQFCYFVISVAHSQPTVPENAKWTILEINYHKLSVA